MSKIYDSTKITDPYYLTTQTPGNYNKSNYFLKELQDKINYDWDYRPNKVTIEEELEKGKDEYTPIEVVIQTVKNDKGQEISDDWRKLVFKDISNRQKIGKRFRFSYNFDTEEAEENKSVWIASNINSVRPTSNVTVVRCNGTLGSVYKDNKGITQYHYEPAIQTRVLKTVNLFYNEVAVVPQSELAVIVQHNKYTQNYYINQRFIVGYDRAYKIKAINKFNSLDTYQPQNVGTILLYLEITEISEQDDFIKRIADNKEEKVEIETTSNEEYTLKLIQPEVLPANLLSTAIKFEVKLFLGEEEVSGLINVNCTLVGTTTPEKYFEFKRIDDNNFTLKRLRFFASSPLQVRCYYSSPSLEDSELDSLEDSELDSLEDSELDSLEDSELEFSLSLKGME